MGRFWDFPSNFPTDSSDGAKPRFGRIQSLLSGKTGKQRALAIVAAMHGSADSSDTNNNHREVAVESAMEEDEENPSFINTAPSEIDAQFQDLMRTSSRRGSKGDGAEEEDDSQDWEWVEETDYFIMDFGGTALDGEDMEKICSSGYSLVVCFRYLFPADAMAFSVGILDEPVAVYSW